MKLWFVVLNLFIAIVAFAKGEIVVRPQSLIQHGSPVVLGDIIDMTSLDKTMKDKLSSVPLAAAPSAGEKLVFSSAAISSFIRTSLANDKSVPHMRIPNHVTIERSTHHWEQPVIEKELLSFWQELCVECQLEIDHLTLPAGMFESWAINPKRELPHGGFSVPVTVSKDGQSNTFWIQGNLVIRKSVPVAKRAFFFGERVQGKDLAWTFRDVTFAQDGIPLEEEIIGRRVKSSIRANDIIFAGTLEREKALKRGDVARVISGHGEWEVSINAVAQADAEVGDTVTLKNPKTNKEVTGVVVAKDEVEIQ